MRLALYLYYWKIIYTRSGLPFNSISADRFAYKYESDKVKKKWYINMDIRTAIKELGEK